MKGIVIAGPTGVGKTELSIKIAQELNAEIISVDSAQVYKGLDIGTAKITEEEKGNILHYMIDITEPINKYNVGDFQREVDKILNEKINKNMVLVGGTGLYIDSIVRGLANLPEGDERIRKTLHKMDLESLFQKLIEIDKESAKLIHPNNRCRVERAIEVYNLTGKKFSELSKENVKGNKFKFLKVALERDRENLYNRINKRVDIMLEKGLFNEVKNLYGKYGENLRKINIIGYSEMIDYIKGILTYEEAVELIKKNSRNYAKRQFTWFKNDQEYIWFNLDKMTENEIFEEIVKLFKSL